MKPGVRRAVAGLAAALLMAALWWESARHGVTIGSREIDFPGGGFGNSLHIVAFGVLATFLVTAFDRTGTTVGLPTRAGRAAFLVTVLWGLSDEVHQFFTPSRTCSVFDVVLDALGPMAALTVPWRGIPSRPRTVIPCVVAAGLGVVIAITFGHWRPAADRLLEDLISYVTGLKKA